MVIFGGRLTHRGVLGQHDDTVVAVAYSYLVFGTNHTERLYTTQLAALDGKFLVAIIEHTAQVGNDYLLAGSHIGGAADDLLGSFLAQVYGGHVQVVRVGMGLAGKHFTHIETLQATTDRLYLFEGAHFETGRGEGCCGFLRSKTEVDILLQPLIRNIHCLLSLLYCVR